MGVLRPSPTATPITSLQRPKATPAPWDTDSFFEASPACVNDGAHWSFSKMSPKAMMTCPGTGVVLTALSQISFSGVTGQLPPTMSVSVEVSSMTGASALASLTLDLGGSSDGVYHWYALEFATNRAWDVVRWDGSSNQRVILASGSFPPTTVPGIKLTADTSTGIPTFALNDTTVATINDGLRYSKGSVSRLSLFGNDGDTALFANFSFAPGIRI
jgi:hypothetical protein